MRYQYSNHGTLPNRGQGACIVPTVGAPHRLPVDGVAATLAICRDVLVAAAPVLRPAVSTLIVLLVSSTPLMRPGISSDARSLGDP